MTASVITIAVCYLVGSSLLLPRDGEPDLGFVVGLSLPLGGAIWSVTGFLALLTGLPVTAETLYAAGIAAAAIILVLRRPALPTVKVALALAAGLAVLILPVLAVHAVRITMDSALMAHMADEIQAARGLTSYVRDWYLMAYPMAVPLLSVPSLASAPTQQLPAFAPAFTASCVLLFASRIFRDSRIAGMSPPFSAVASAGASGLAFFSHHMLFQATYLNGHVIAAALILGFFAAPRALEEGDRALAAQAVCVTGIVFLRLEGVLVGILMVATQPYPRGGGARSRTILAGILACAATLYHGGVLLVSHPVANFASLIDPKLAWALVVAGWLFFAGVAAISRLGWARVARALPGLALGGLTLIIAGLALAKPGHMLLVIVNVYRNMLWAGGWGPTWIVLWIGFLGGLLMHRDAARIPGLLFSVGYVLLVVALGGLNVHPYRSPGFLDSGNRMMVHILPLMCWAVTCCWLAGINVGLASRHRRVVASE